MRTAVCVGCRRDVPLKGIEEVYGFAICPMCGAVFMVAGVSVHDGLPLFRRPGRISLPPSFSVNLTGTDPLEGAEYRANSQARELVMSWPVDDARLDRWMLWLFFLVLWMFAGSFLYDALNGSREEFFFIAALSAIPGLVCAYLLLAVYVNRTHLSITSGSLRIHHAPLPWSDGATLQIDDIEQVFCARTRGGQRSGITFFTLNARLRSGGVRPVVSNLRHPRIAMAIQQRIEETLELPPGATVSAVSFIEEIERAQRARKARSTS